MYSAVQHKKTTVRESKEYVLWDKKKLKKTYIQNVDRKTTQEKMSIKIKRKKHLQTGHCTICIVVLDITQWSKLSLSTKKNLMSILKTK